MSLSRSFSLILPLPLVYVASSPMSLATTLKTQGSANGSPMSSKSRGFAISEEKEQRAYKIQLDRAGNGLSY